MRFPFAAICSLAAFAALAGAQDKPAAELGLPWGPTTRLVSADGSRVLFGLPSRKGPNAPLVELWFEDMRTKQRQRLMGVGGTLSAFWSPDGSAFVVNPGISDQAQAYVYDAETLVRLDIGQEIMAADPSLSRFTPGKAHSYFAPVRWENNSNVMVRFHGHTDSAPILCFTFVYRVSRAGRVERLSENVFPISPESLCRE